MKQYNNRHCSIIDKPRVPTRDEFEKFYEFLYPDEVFDIKENHLKLYAKIAQQLKRAKEKADETIKRR